MSQSGSWARPEKKSFSLTVGADHLAVCGGMTGSTSLILAAGQGRAATVKELLESGKAAVDLATW
eukprot:scaffold547045_cov50-Prasinocladus_malaysianus.AAC.1